NPAGQPNVSVTSSTSAGHTFYAVTFQNDLAHQDVQQIKGRELSTLVDSALPAAFGPGGGESLPEGLRGAIITIVDAQDNPELVGQSRLILFQDAATGTLVVNKPWSFGPSTSSIPNTAQYEIKLFTGKSVPNVRVQIFTNATPAIVVSQSEGSTSVAEISSNTTAGELTTELTNRQADQIDVRLSKMPSGPMTVNLNGNNQLEFFDLDNLAGGAITSLSFNSG